MHWANFALLKIEQKQYIVVGVLQFPPKVVFDPGKLTIMSCIGLIFKYNFFCKQSETCSLRGYRGVPGRRFGENTWWVRHITSTGLFSSSFSESVINIFRLFKMYLIFVFSLNTFTLLGLLLYIIYIRGFWQSRFVHIQGAVFIGQRPEPTRSCVQIYEPSQSSCHVELSQGIVFVFTSFYIPDIHAPSNLIIPILLSGSSFWFPHDRS